MKLVYPLTRASEVSSLLSSAADEFLICSSEFSRFGELSLSEAQDVATKFRDAGKRSVFCFDILMTENVFAKKIALLNQVDLSLFDAVRVQDPGALELMREHPSNLPVQLILETGNHNTKAIHTWAQIAGERLERLILSLEWPKAELLKLLAEKKYEFELMGLGPILLFYSPRSLVRPLVKGDEADQRYILDVYANSEESPHKGFRVLENSHGTFMFHPKHHGLLSEVLELERAGLFAFRVELLASDSLEILERVAGLLALTSETEVKESARLISEEYTHTLIQGFYKVNKSNVLFKKLKNDRLSARSDLLIGHVLDYKKGRPLLVKNLHPTRDVVLGEELRFLSTEGKTKTIVLDRLQNLHGDLIAKLAPGELGLFPFVGSMSVKSQVFWNQ